MDGTETKWTQKQHVWTSIVHINEVVCASKASKRVMRIWAMANVIKPYLIYNGILFPFLLIKMIANKR